MNHADDAETLIEKARAEYARNEMDDPVLLDGTSEMHAKNALDHLRDKKWNEALSEARVAAQQRDRWKTFLAILERIHGLQT